MKLSLQRWRWCVLLPAVHVAIALAIIVPQEVHEWIASHAPNSLKHTWRWEDRDEYERQDRLAERARKRCFWAGCENEKEPQFLVEDAHPVSRVTLTVAVLDPPAFIVVGWYGHRTASEYEWQEPLAWPLLGVFADTMRLRRRIMVLDSIFIVTIALQWWLLGVMADSSRWGRRTRRVVRGAMLAITVPGVVIGCVASFSDAMTRWDPSPVFLVMLLAAIGWLVLACLVVGVVARWCFAKGLRFIES